METKIESDSERRSSPEKAVRCELCGVELSDEAELATHREGHAEKVAEGQDPVPPGPRHRCAYCSEAFYTPEELRDHHATSHLR
jgi:hypothetical protein